MKPIDDRKPIGIALAFTFAILVLYGMAQSYVADRCETADLWRGMRVLQQNQADLRSHENKFMRDVAAWANRGAELRAD